MEPPLDEEEFRRWRDEAGRALEGARVQAGAGLHNWACFAAEQAAQLALKALLHGLGRGPWGHDLVRLGELAGEAGLVVPEALAGRLRRLGRHYIPARYPDAHAAGPPSAHYASTDSDEAAEDAGEVLSFVDRTWKELHG
ncbi:MAG TPA: HEPN domain-containing protein [Actinomycetota bacterium]|nr:HEPN domain-containing protein [Actinomycetota bacterium]